MNFLSTKPYRGTRDFLPEEMSVRTQVFNSLFATAERYGFRRYDGPILESAEIYEAKSGEEIANQQLYRLEDKSGRQLALRPEMTPSVARIVARNENELSFPLRWYSFVNCHRYERPQKGRVREHWQLNVDIFGSENLDAEVEIFDLIADLMSSIKATPEMYVVRANDRVLIEGALKNFVGISSDDLVNVSMVIDRWEKTSQEVTEKNLFALGLTVSQISNLSELVKMDFASFCEIAGKEAVKKSNLAKVLNGNLTQANVVFDPLIIRAFNYYTSTVFEVFDQSPIRSRSIFGGGRYDNLASLFTDKKIPGIGFGMGDVTTWNFLEIHNLLPQADLGPDVYVFATREEDKQFSKDLCRTLRKCGIRTSYAFEASTMKRGLKQADRQHSKYTVVVDEKERTEGCVLIKNMIDFSQCKVRIDEVPKYIKEKFI